MNLEVTPDPDRSALLLATMIQDEEPFFFVRIGDGALELLSGRHGATCDGEQYTPELARSMARCIDKLKLRDTLVYWGDWTTATAGSQPKMVTEWCDLIHPENRKTLDYEALLLMRRSTQLMAFYRAVWNDPRRKMYIGAHAEAGLVLGCMEGENSTLVVPMGGLFEYQLRLSAQLLVHKPEVILFGAGMGGLIPIVDYWSERALKTTCIHLGSALDPLFCSSPTRARQLSRSQATDFFKELL